MNIKFSKSYKEIGTTPRNTAILEVKYPIIAQVIDSDETLSF